MNFLKGVFGLAGRFSVYWFFALAVMGLGFYAPVAEHIGSIQEFNLNALKWVASKLPYYFSSPVLNKLRGFVQSEAFIATELTALVIGFIKLCVLVRSRAM